MARSVLEIDEITGDYFIKIPEDCLEELGWDENDPVQFHIRSFANQDVLIVSLK